MCDSGNVWTGGEGGSFVEARAPMASSSSYLSVMHQIHVLLVDHESDALLNIAEMLKMCQYRVTLVQLASAAMTMLINGKSKFDMIIANMNSPDLSGFKLVQQAVGIDIPIILLSNDENTFMAMKAIESGALLYLKKPMVVEMLTCLWQHVLKEKTRMARENETFASTNYYYGMQGELGEILQRGDKNPNDINGNNILEVDDKGKSRKRARCEIINQPMAKQKMSTKWTQELHEKFMDAIEQLGEGRCFPKEIWKLMNVPGLTRMQVASHLQICRKENWRSFEERKSSNLSANQVSSGTKGSQPKLRRFGYMPCVSKPSPKQTLTLETTAITPDVLFTQTTQSETMNMAIKNNSRVQSTNNNARIGNDNIVPIYKHYETLIPLGNTGGATNASPSAHMSPLLPPMDASTIDEYFNFSELDCLIKNFHPASPLGMKMVSNPSSTLGGFPKFEHGCNSP